MQNENNIQLNCLTVTCKFVNCSTECEMKGQEGKIKITSTGKELHF